MSTTVTPADLDRAAEEIEALLAKYNAKVSSIYGVADVIRGIWDSEASRQFQTKMEIDRPSYDSLKTFLSEYTTIALPKIAQSYRKGEAGAVDAITGQRP
jgi:hypothetical protein